MGCRDKNKVVLGMSGGTDSSVTAMLLQQKGYEVIGVSLWFWNSPNEDSDHKELPHFIVDAQQLAKKLSIEHHVIDARDEFKDVVIGQFLQEYLNGRTPSPCIHCNPNLKWRLLLDKADQLGVNYIATGHYIQILEEDGTFYIHKGDDPAKDQSYFLWNLNQEILSRTLTPLGAFTKPEVREMATDFGHKTVASKKESMGICFLDGMDYRDFLKQEIGDVDEKIGKGKIVDTDGKELGWHEGYPYYTIGQKRGLELKEKTGLMVSRIDAESNTLVIEKREKLNKKEFGVSGYYLNNEDDINNSEITTIVRGLGLNPEGHSKLTIIDEHNLKVELDNPAWAIAPGQPVAFYIGNKLIGGGFAE
ncbi:tRNA 2-thiouridine(34) synthase MnmA [Ancylomarina sp. YFZ004]